MKNVRIGIFGLNRGYDNLDPILVNGGEVVAICDKKQELLDRASKKLGDVKTFTDFDEFIKTDMDAVYLANCFDEHTPFAIKALERNIHVISECTSNSTMAEGVALIRAAEKSKAFFMLAENYPYMMFNQEMKRIYEGGTLGEVYFAEGEYNHPVSAADGEFLRRYYDSVNHWRNYLPATYYITHSLGPLMRATNAKPVRVTAFPIYKPQHTGLAKRSADKAAIITILNDDSSVFRVTGCAGFGAHENSYRLACRNGQIENQRGTTGKVMLRYNDWQIPEGKQADNCYYPEEDPKDAALAKAAGHDGGDYYMFKDFFACIRENKKNYLDEYVATTMASIAILAHRSILNGGAPYDIPDFSKEEDRVKYENDTLTPFWHNGIEPNVPSCSHPEYLPSEEDVRLFEDMLAGRK